MGRPRKMVPELKFLGAENCYVARFAGRRRRYGPDKEQAEARFKADLQAWLANGSAPSPGPAPAGEVTINDVSVAHLEAVRPRISKAQYVHHETAIAALVDGWGNTPADSFGLQDLRAFRDRMATRFARIPQGAAHLLWELLKDGPRPSGEVEKIVRAAGHSGPSYARARGALGVVATREGRKWVSSLHPATEEPGAPRKLSRRYINKHVAIVQRAFKLAAVRGQVAPRVAAELAMLPPLEYREGGRETAARAPAVASDVTAILAVLGEPWLSVARLQGVTGMRPAEALAFRWDRVSRDPATPVNVEAGGAVVPVSAVKVGEAAVWIYAPDTHKTRHKSKPRLIALGVKAQALLAPFLGRKGFVFGTQKGRKCRPTDAFDWEIRRRCRRLGIRPWTPHQLRHGFATAAAQTGDLADLQAQLGHSSAAMTSHYINNLAARAARLAE